jgi:hypothetical protein
MLLEKDHPTVLRRLAREVNQVASQCGCYYQGQKITGASFTRGQLVLFGLGRQAIAPVDSDAIFDGYGRHITASRENS